eukprot:2726909-Pleurochrysis_carterae.AAC.1
MSHYLHELCDLANAEGAGGRARNSGRRVDEHRSVPRAVVPLLLGKYEAHFFHGADRNKIGQAYI